MTIVLVPNASVGWSNGFILVESNLIEFIGDITKENQRLVIASFVINSNTARRLPYKGKDTYLFSLGSMHKSNSVHKFLAYCKALPSIINLIYKYSCFYIFTPGHVSSIFTLLCIIFRKKYALYLRGDWNITTIFFFRLLKRVIFRKASFILATGNDFVDEIKKYNIRCEAVVPMIQVLSTDMYSDRQYSINAPVKLLFVGYLVSSKGIYDLVKATAILLSRKGAVHLDIIGDGADRMNLNALIQELGISSHVVVHGNILDAETLKAAYRQADIFVFPSHHEGFPRVLYEAMTFGLPIVTTNVGAVSGVMGHLANCLFSRTNDPMDLATNIEQLINDPILRESIGTGGLATMERFFAHQNNTSHSSQFLGWLRKAAIPVGR